jgi:hypothetical protein
MISYHMPRSQVAERNCQEIGNTQFRNCTITVKGIS